MLAKEKYPRLLFLGKDREQYITALKSANYGLFTNLNVVMANLLFAQRSEKLVNDLEKLSIRMTEDIEIVGKQKVGQLKLSDFLFA
jgi:hypothetical protein